MATISRGIAGDNRLTGLHHRSVAVIGTASDPRAWSGTPYHFWRAGLQQGFVTDAIDLPIEQAEWRRRLWAVGRIMRRRRPAGFQYSPSFLDWAESQIPARLLAGEVISFSQHFPRAATVRRAGGRISYYIDATFVALSSGRGLDLQLPRDVVAAARVLECENFALADRVITMARWAAASVIDDCGVAAEKVYTVMPGANLELPAGWTPPGRPPGRPGRDRPFVLGFVGKDWQRKGLPLVCAVRDELTKRGRQSIVRVIGEASKEIVNRAGVEFLGCIDKRQDADRFVAAIASCDLGCLFSQREALGISTLEFLRVGVPVAGFAIEGPADALPSDAGFRFTPSQSAAEIATTILETLEAQESWNALATAARRWSPLLSWERCVDELHNVWLGVSASHAVRPWLGLPAVATMGGSAL